MTKRASIVSAFSSFAEPQSGVPEGEVVVRKAPARVPAGIIGATQRTMSDIRQERDDLAERLAKANDAAGAGMRELDAALLDPSPFQDRLVDADDAEFDRLKRLIAEEGQKVAIQVRAHPLSAGRFQIVYGHRRWRAAKELGRPVKAEVVEATDEQLAVAQGLENSSRQDLTWIERALYAWRLEGAGIKAQKIRAALAVDDAELARFRAVCRVVPSDVIVAIGRAPRVGRPRWSDLAAAAAASVQALDAIRKTLSADKVSKAISDERFRLVLEGVRKPKPSPVKGLALRRPDGRTVGRLSISGGDVRIKMEKGRAEAFSGFLQSELPDLLAKFFASVPDADSP